MNHRRLRVLVVGGYGVFGGRITQLLADDPRLTLILAGRSKAQAAAFCATLPAQATLMSEYFDRSTDVETQLKAIAPDLVIDASGPFQAYGDNPYGLVKAAIVQNVNYLDLADGSDFVAGIARFNEDARQRGLFVLSGVSSFPVLTAAVCRRLAHGVARTDVIAGGIAPSPYAGVGLNVIQAISSYAGKELRLTRDGRAAAGYGLTETMRYTIGPPGRLPLKNTLFSLVDVPDLTVLPQQWPEVRSIWMGAGPVPELLHRTLIALAWTVRLRLVPSITILAPLFHTVINTARWGEHRGGMFVRIEGTTASGERVSRSWHLLAEGDDGPLIPAMAIEAIVRKCLADESPRPGARSAVCDLELQDYESLFARRTIVTGFREANAADAKAPLYKRILGPAFNALPQPVRDMHDFQGTRIATGSADVERGSNGLSRIVGWVFRFPPAGRDVPLTVRFACDGHRETWVRTFGKTSFSSRQAEGTGRSDKLLVESFGIFDFALALVCAEDKLSLVLRRWSCLGLPLPLSPAPKGEAYEYARDSKFHFNVEIRLPLVGLIVRYRGTLVSIDTTI